MKLFLLSALIFASRISAITEASYNKSLAPEKAFANLLTDIETDGLGAKSQIGSYRKVIRDKLRGSVETAFGRDYLSKNVDAQRQLVAKAAEYGPIELLRLLHVEFKLPYHAGNGHQPLFFAFKRLDMEKVDDDAVNVFLEIVRDQKTVSDLKPVEAYDKTALVKLLGHAASQLAGSYEGREFMLKVFEFLKAQLSEHVRYILLDYFMAQYAQGGKAGKNYYELLNEMEKKKMVSKEFAFIDEVTPSWEDRSVPNLAEINKDVEEMAKTLFTKHGQPLMMATIFKLPFWLLKDLAKASGKTKDDDEIFNRYVQQMLASSLNQSDIVEILRVPRFEGYLKSKKSLMTRIMKLAKNLTLESVYPMTLYEVLVKAYKAGPSKKRFMGIVQKVLDFARDHDSPGDLDVVFHSAISAYFKKELETASTSAKERLSKPNDTTPFVAKDGDVAKVLAAAYLVSAKTAGGARILDAEIDGYAWGRFSVSLVFVKDGRAEELPIDKAMQRLAETDQHIQYWLRQRNQPKKKPRKRRG